MQMCLCCTNHVKHLLRIVRASEDKSFRFWREEEWFRTILDAHFGESTVPETTNESLIMLQNFMLNALRDNLHVWQSHSLRTPTAEADPSPTGLLFPAPPRTVPPGLPTPNAEVGALNAEADQGAQGGGRSDVPLPSSVPLLGSSLLLPPQGSEPPRSSIPADQGARRNVGFVPLFGRSEVKDDRADVENEGVIALMERDALIADLQRQVRDLQAQNNVQNNVSNQTRSGVIPNRFGLMSKAPPEGDRIVMQKLRGLSTPEHLHHRL